MRREPDRLDEWVMRLPFVWMGTLIGHRLMVIAWDWIVVLISR